MKEQSDTGDAGLAREVVPAEGYRQMAADAERETEALEWAEALIGDVSED
jgi:hypothetical protein